MNLPIEAIMNYVVTDGVNLIIKLAASLAIWVIGRRIISMLMGVVNRAIVRGGKLDATTSRYITFSKAPGSAGGWLVAPSGPNSTRRKRSESL